MSTYREILNFQLGNYSNYVSTHWWNIQESYFTFDENNPSELCHDVLFREGKTLKGAPTFTPRTVIVDKKENAIHTPVLDENLNAPQASTTSTSQSTVVWDSDRISSEFMDMPEKHEYIQDLEKMDKGQHVSKKDYDFEHTVRSWCDFMRTRYHPKSLSLINNNYQTDIFLSGLEIYKHTAEAIEEKVRSFVEECNNLQGFHLLSNADDAYGGLAYQTALHLQDEYPNKAIFAMPMIPSFRDSTGIKEDVRRMINILLCYQKLSEHCDIIIPLSTNKTAWRGLGPPIHFPYLNYEPSSFYQTSAIIASYLDTFSLKYRVKSEASNLAEVASGLNFWNRKICAASVSLPFPISSKSYLLNTLENLEESSPLWNCLTPGCTIGSEKIFYQRITIRGMTRERLRDPSVSRRDSQAYACRSVPELLHLYLSFYLNTISDVTALETPLKTESPFPNIFSRRISLVGSTEDNIAREQNTEVLSCPVLTGLHSCKDIGRMLESLYGNVKGVNIKRFHQFIGVGMDLDEYKECLEKVLLLGNEYVNDMDSL